MLKNRTPGFWLGLVAAVVALVADILLFVIARGDLTFSLTAFVVILAGVLSFLLVLGTDLKLAPMIPALFFAAGTALHLHQGIPSVTDIINDIVYIGGNGWYCIYFGIAFLAATFLSCVSCYMKQRKA